MNGISVLKGKHERTMLTKRNRNACRAGKPAVARSPYMCEHVRDDKVLRWMVVGRVESKSLGSKSFQS